MVTNCSRYSIRNYLGEEQSSPSILIRGDCLSELNKAEKYFEHNLNEILHNGHKDRNPRPKYDSGEDATSTFITQIVEEYDISKGEMPITETRYIGWKSAINELLAIYQSQTNTQDGFERHGVSWWKPWMNENGDIGRAYSHNLESHRLNEMKRAIVKVESRLIDKDNFNIDNSHFKNVNMNNSLDGETYFCDDGEYIILEKYRTEDDKGKRRTYKKIQFLNTGFITSCRADSKGAKDRYKRSVCGVGYLDDEFKIKNIQPELRDKLFSVWCSMIKRCYDINRHDAKYYKDIFVHKDWHSFANFVNDCFTIPQFQLAKENNFKNYHLDKDYFNSNGYGKETCVFLHADDNQLYRNTKLIRITNEDEIKYFIKLQDVIDYIGAGHVTSLHTALNTTNEYKYYKVEYIETDEIYRYELSRNQINELLNELIHNKFSRRHMTSFFNWSNHNKKMLIECAFETLWTAYEKDGDTYLDLTLIQRSSDVLTANHINKIQYVALMMMVAKHCGYKCGKFVHFVQNYHIYNNHIENLEVVLERIQQLKQRPVQSAPKLILNVPDGTNFYDIKVEDFELVDYNPIKPQLKFDLAI